MARAGGGGQAARPGLQGGLRHVPDPKAPRQWPPPALHKSPWNLSSLRIMHGWISGNQFPGWPQECGGNRSSPGVSSPSLRGLVPGSLSPGLAWGFSRSGQNGKQTSGPHARHKAQSPGAPGLFSQTNCQGSVQSSVFSCLGFLKVLPEAAGGRDASPCLGGPQEGCVATSPEALPAITALQQRPWPP